MSGKEVVHEIQKRQSVARCGVDSLQPRLRIFLVIYEIVVDDFGKFFVFRGVTGGIEQDRNQSVGLQRGTTTGCCPEFLHAAGVARRFLFHFFKESLDVDRVLGGLILKTKAK